MGNLPRREELILLLHWVKTRSEGIIKGSRKLETEPRVATKGSWPEENGNACKNGKGTRSEWIVHGKSWINMGKVVNGRHYSANYLIRQCRSFLQQIKSISNGRGSS